jgi:putative DNA primase/helicase
MKQMHEQYHQLPEELRQRPQWILMRTKKSPSGRLLKLPWNPHKPRESASIANPTTWSAFDHVLDVLKPGDHPAFALTEDDPYVLVDFDKCLFDRRIVRQVHRDVAYLASYTEVSVSGTGLHVIARGSLPVAGRKNKDLEMYQSGRFVLLTGTIYERRDTINDRQQELMALYERSFPKSEVRSRPEQARTLADEELLERAFRAKNGRKVRDLYDGKWENYYRTQSEADAALCSLVGFYSQSAEQVDRLFRRSGLFREKWDEVHFADGSTYGEKTVDRALKQVSRTFAAEATVYRK